LTSKLKSERKKLEAQIAMKARELLIMPMILLLSGESLHADSATWNLNPGSDDLEYRHQLDARHCA